MASVVTAMMETKTRRHDDGGGHSTAAATAAATPTTSQDAWESERDSLLTRLLDSVKQCQIRFGKKQTLATEAEARVICLLTNLEAVLGHGLKPAHATSSAISSIFSSSSSKGSADCHVGGVSGLWSYVKTFLGSDELSRFNAEFHHVNTDIGRGRAWLRTALNENTLERYFYTLVNDAKKIQLFYEKWSFMCDEEKSSMLPSMAAGLKTILFNVTTDAAELNHAPKTTENRTILNSMLRDSILSSSLPGNNSPHTPSSYIDSEMNENFLEPVIISPKEELSKNNSGTKPVNGKTTAADDKSSSSSTTSSKKVGSKKKKKTVAHIVNLDAADAADADKERSSSFSSLTSKTVVTPKTTTTTTDIRDDYLAAQSRHGGGSSSTAAASDDAAATTTTTIVTSQSTAQPQPSPLVARHHRASDPPSALTLSDSTSTTTPVIATFVDDAPGKSETAAMSSSKELRDVISGGGGKQTKESEGMTFVCGGGGAGVVMSPVTPTSKGFPVPSYGQDGDSSDALSVKSAGQASQGSLVSSTTSELSTSLSFQNGHGFPSATPFSSGTNHNYHHQHQAAAPTLLALHNDRIDGIRKTVERKVTSASSRDDLDTLSSVELRDAIVSIMQRKDEVVELNEDLQNRVERLQQENAGLHDEVERLERKMADAVTKSDSKTKMLQRENELLKHQLKKYVGTVRVLERRQTTSTEEATTGGDGGGATTALERQLDDSAAHLVGGKYVVDADADQIRESYEQKLVQVSEMHSDLMEFNDTLVVQVRQKDRVIDQLKMELEDLRGPLPLDYGENADTMSIISEAELISSSSTTNIPSSASSCSFRALVNIWIPSAFLQTTNKDTFHVYQVYIRIRDEEWNVYRRYAQFYDLHKTKKKQFPDVAAFPFPPKKALGNKDEQFVEDRRIKLQQYLRQLLNFLTQCTGYELAHAHPITKERLLNALPFFSDRTLTSSESGSVGGKSPSFSRGRLRTAEEPTTPQYMGL